MSNAIDEIVDKLDFSFLQKEKYLATRLEPEELKNDFVYFVYEELLPSRRDLIHENDMKKFIEIAEKNYDIFTRHRLSNHQQLHKNAYDRDGECRSRWLQCLFDYERVMSKRGYTVSMVDVKERYFGKYNLIAEKNFKVTRVKLKARTKFDREDIKVDDEFLWVELRGVYGEKGWIYGSADIVVFETEKEFLIFKKEELIDRVYTLVDKFLLLNDKLDVLKYYMAHDKVPLFQRYRRNDEIAILPSRKLRDLAVSITK